MRRLAVCLTVAVALAGCRDDGDRAPQRLADSIAPIGTGTERLLTRERLDLLAEWIGAAVGRGAPIPPSLDDIRPPSDQASLYVPLERYLRDGWGRRIEYDVNSGAGAYELRSPGEDGVAGTGDDIVQRGEF